MIKKCFNLALLALAFSASCFATELVLVDSDGVARSYMVNEQGAQFDPLHFDASAPARAIFINADVVTVQEYKANEHGVPIMSVTIYNKFPSS